MIQIKTVTVDPKSNPELVDTAISLIRKQRNKIHKVDTSLP